MVQLSLEDWMKSYHKLGGIDLMINATKEKFINGGAVILKAQSKMQDEFQNISKDEMFEMIAKQYIEKLMREFHANQHPGKKITLYVSDKGKRREVLQPFSDIDKAIIMTYEKYINGYQGLTPTEVAFSCLKSLVYGDENNFTKHVDDKGISAHEYASQYVYSMSTISSDWKASCFMQMMQDVCLEYSKQNEQAQKKQHESPITIKKFFPSVFFRAKEKLSSGIINGVERRVPGNLPGMYFAQDIGNTGKKQEDAIIVMEHPSFKGLRMAMISDGMGGTNNGEVASHMVIAELKKWFEKLRIDPDSVDTGTLRMSLAQKIKEISSKIIKTQGENCGATLTGAIIGKKDAVVVNIGDSRTYLVKNGNLRQVTVDHSLAQIEYENYFRNVYPGMKPDDMRFWRRSNEITRSIGINVDNSIPDFVHLDKGAFDKLILCSDGVSDCLSFDQVATYSNRLSKKELANALVNGGLITVSDFDKNMDGLVRQIPAGKDDTTAVVD